MYYGESAEVTVLLGMTFVSVTRDGDKITFVTADNRTFKLYHDQECCESVSIESIVGDLQDLVGSPITLAEESSSEESRFGKTPGGDDGDEEWSFYRFATVKGYVDIRWYGESNGYYSTSVDFCEVTT